MDSIKCLDAFAIDKPTDMEIDGEATDYMDGTDAERRRSSLEATRHRWSHNLAKEFGMGGSRPPLGRLCQEDQDRQADHSYQKHFSIPIESVSAIINIPIC